MTETDSAVVPNIRDTSPVVDAVCRQIERRLPPHEAYAATDFASLFFSRAPAEYLQERSPDALAHVAAGAFAFLQKSRPDRVDVQVFNPDVDNEGWYAPVTVIRTNVGERPFIVDTIREYLHSQDIAIEHYIYPVLGIVRKADGTLLQIGPPQEAEQRESLVHCEVARVTDPDILKTLKQDLERRLQDVVRVTDDFDPMVDALNNTVAALAERARSIPERREGLEEIQSFLRWLRDGAFVLLGHRAYDMIDLPNGAGPAMVVDPGSGLGILRNEAESTYADPVPLADLPNGLRELIVSGPTLIISKTNAASTVHRGARMDYIGVKKLDEDGRPVGEARFIGLFTSRAYGEEADKIPILRQKLRRILVDTGAPEGSHDYKEINTIFNSMPKEELFLSSAEQIGKDVKTVLTSYHTTEVRVTRREDPLRRGTSIMVIIPKDKFSGEVRETIEDAFVGILEGEVLNYHLAMGGGDQARLHFYVKASTERLEAVKDIELERLVQELIRDWSDRVREGLERVRPPDEARRLARRYGAAFSAEYRASTDPEAAVKDILEIEAMDADGRTIAISFANPERSTVAAADRVTELRVYLLGPRLVLSDFMPILENAGLRVIAVSPAKVEGRSVPAGAIYTFAVQDGNKSPLDIESRGTLLADAILAVRAGDVTNDRLNNLVLTAGLAWREADVLRAYSSYAFQFGAVPSRLSIPTALLKYPAVARLLVDLFETLFDPEGRSTHEERTAAAAEIRQRFLAAVHDVYLLADDRALRHVLTLIDATVRTNYYATGGRTPTKRSGGVPYTSFKVMVRAMRSLTRTRLLFEVWVRSARMEGVHLRGARVARGGIRYSDRPDDFRTEVLGLVETQMVKNAVIVPAGSKGGFVILGQPLASVATADEVEEQYKTLIRGLLDVTDNLKHGESAPPENVVCYDEPDPYLVVAADKGTATFSDVANAVAAEYDFWMGDAFASGGSNGYDHKTVGITARGAWECVRRHFWETRKDIQSQPFTVVGIGDMSGDVFGNGMLLSRKIKLLGAFDHRHIFIDPDPDPEGSFNERQRLFALRRSSWEDYDQSLLSPGGMIVPRGAKEVELSPEVRSALGVSDDVGAVDGEYLVRLMLKAPVELLWNGGIGTYVKASYQTHADVSDPANDPVRIDAPALRARVVGEGGNRGLTQLGRIELALGGGRLNTDALDNSGGVDLSDREVNLKILLNSAVEDGHMSMEERNGLLEVITEAVSKLVLRDNASQSLAISLDEIRASEGVEDFRQLISALERDDFLDRADERLPTWETLVDRVDEGKTLTRPELSVLLAYAKLHLMSRLLKGALIDDVTTQGYLTAYFPRAAIRAAGQDALSRHRLHGEIVASQLTNDLVDLMGAGFVHRMMRDTGRSAEEVATAWLVASRLSGHGKLMDRLREREGTIAAKVIYRWFLGLSRVLERTTRWVLANVEPEAVPTIVEQNLAALTDLRGVFGDIVTGEDRDTFESLVAEIQHVGAGEDFGRTLVTLRFLDQLMDILRVSTETDTVPEDAARAFYKVSELLQVPWLRRAIYDSARDDRWEQRAAQALADDLTRAHHRLASRAAGAASNGKEVEDAVQELVERRRRDMDRYGELLDELRGEGTVTLSGLAVAVREIAVLSERAEGSGGSQSG